MPVIPGAKDMATKQKPTKEPVMKGKLFVWALFLAGLFGIFMWGVPTYRVWSAEMHGRAQKAEAEYSRDTIKIEAAARAEAEVTRAKGVAQANRIIADSLKGNQDYLHYLWIQTLSEDNKTIVYIPTEANIPIMEATRAVTPDRVE
ncbi:MAG TPA: membrane protease subunit [Myxococcota bacterium]|nr:membrane protease subunit [Myxococcota bacterium]